MKERLEKYLPIGTVVMLKGGKKRVMITGFCSIAEENKEKTYDYSGCLYPEGYLTANQVCLFDHEQIEKIYHLGLIDEEEKSFKVKLENFMKGLSNDTNHLTSSQAQDEKANINLNKENVTDLNLDDDTENNNNDDDFFVIK